MGVRVGAVTKAMGRSSHVYGHAHVHLALKPPHSPTQQQLAPVKTRAQGAAADGTVHMPSFHELDSLVFVCVYARLYVFMYACAICMYGVYVCAICVCARVCVGVE